MKYAIILDTDRPDFAYLATDLFDTRTEAEDYITSYCGDRRCKIIAVTLDDTFATHALDECDLCLAVYEAARAHATAIGALAVTQSDDRTRVGGEMHTATYRRAGTTNPGPDYRAADKLAEARHDLSDAIADREAGVE